MLLPVETMVADTRKQIHLNVAVSSAVYYRRKGAHGKIKCFISWLGEKLFPDLPEKKRQRITLQIIVGISLAFVCMAGMGIFRYKAVRQLEKYQAIADAYAQLDIILEEGREQSQKEAAAELEEFFSEMEADAERYRQEYETEMRELGLEAYDWDALCSENEDIKGWLCIPDTLINFPVVGTDDNAFYLSHDHAARRYDSAVLHLCPAQERRLDPNPHMAAD